MTSRYGGTPGKLFLGLRVIDGEGNYLTLSAATLRMSFYLAYSLIRGAPPSHEPLLRFAATFSSTAILAADLFRVFLGPLRQTWHDRLAGSFVISRSPAGPTSAA
jgi:uncharacterized RDD family membrane protein YckC